MVEPARRAVGVRDVDELVRGDREAQPGARLGPVVELDPLVQAVAEHVLGERAVRADVRRQQVDVVEPLDRRAPADVALRLVPPRRPQVLGRLVALRLVVELEDVPVGVGEAVRPAVADVPVDPAEPEPRRLDGRHPPVERLGAPRPQRDVPEPGLRRLRELQAVAEVVAPAPQEDGLPVARLLLHAEHVDEEAEALLGLRGQELRVPDPGDVVDRLAHRSRRAAADRRGRTRARRPRASRASRARAPRARGPPSAPRRPAPARRRPRRPRRARRRRPDGSSRPPTSTGSPIDAGTRFSAPLHANVARPDRQPELAELLDVAHRGVHEQRGDAATFACVASSSPTSATGPGSGIVSTSTSPGSASATAAWTMRLSSWPQRTVRAGPAAREPGTTWISGTSTTERAPAASCTVAVPSRASSREHVRHSALTTCGVTRWNASA